MFKAPPPSKVPDIGALVDHADTREDTDSNVQAVNDILEFHGLPFAKGVSPERTRAAITTKTPATDSEGVIIRKEKYFPLLAAVEVPVIYASQLEYTAEEKKERCLAFLNLYSESGLRSRAAKAVGVPYGRVMLWISEDPVLRLELEIAEQSVQSQYEDIAHVLAASGDGSMIRFQLKRHEGRVVTRVGEDMSVTGGGSMANVLNILEQASKNAKSIKGETE